MSTIADLQDSIANLERGKGERQVLPLHCPMLDQALQGGLERGALHEFSGAGAVQWLSKLPIDQIGNWVWLNVYHSQNMALMPYGVGLAGTCLDPNELLWVNLNAADRLSQVANEIMSEQSINLLVIATQKPLNLSDARKLHLAARQSNALCLILDMRLNGGRQPICSNAMTRWHICFDHNLANGLKVDLLKNRYGAPLCKTMSLDELWQSFGYVPVPALHERVSYG